MPTRSKSSKYFVELGRRRAIKIFKNASKRVPAYRHFLRQNAIRVNKIKTWADFQRVPTVDRNNYLKKYPLEQLCWDGSLDKPLVYTSTSGSTGKPTYFVRDHRLDWQYSSILEGFIRNSSYGVDGPILVIVGFGMGIWIGGLITYQAFKLIAERKKYPISIITPGINAEEIIKILINIAPKYQQVILAGYPPFVKDVLDDCRERHINLRKLNLRFLFAAEAITERFRDYVANIAGVKNIYRDTLNIYGTADIGAMAYENTLSILLKRLAQKHTDIRTSLFPNAVKNPTVGQYNPEHVQFEELNGELILTGDSAIPLIRYRVGDHGGVFSYNDMVKAVAKNINLSVQISRARIINSYNEFPFVYVYERSDLSASLYGINIYPEYIRDSLLSGRIRNALSGRFTLITRCSTQNDQYLEVNAELKKNRKATKRIIALAQDTIHESLLSKSSEYKELVSHIIDRKLLKVILWESNSPQFFKKDIKQRWVQHR